MPELSPLQTRSIVSVIVAVLIVLIIVGILIAVLIYIAVTQQQSGKRQSACTNDGHCDHGFVCDNSQCKGIAGTFCKVDTDCLSNSCNVNTKVCS